MTFFVSVCYYSLIVGLSEEWMSLLQVADSAFSASGQVRSEEVSNLAESRC